MIFYRMLEINSILKANFLFYFMDIVRIIIGKLTCYFFYYSIIYL